MANDLVGYSRAGDVFHYRWAARRCLGMLYPNSLLKFIVVEGSAEKNKAGEYVIDVCEYYGSIDVEERIDYFQLKHTTVHKEDHFTLSDLEKTLKGFSDRFKQHYDEGKKTVISFTILTNRKIELKLKNKIKAVALNEPVDAKFKSILEKYTGLTAEKLSEFCSIIIFEDSEGDYNAQKSELRIEISQLVAGSLDHSFIDSIGALIQEKVLPDSDGRIVKEEVFSRLGITSQREIFPAAAIWETEDLTIKREQHDELISTILQSIKPVIVHAAGGVGKSVFSRQLIKSLPDGSVGIAYDCFGAGRYRNRSESRHMHREALVQIANELAAKGLCDPLFVQNTTLEKDIMHKFTSRLSSAVNSLQLAYPSASLVILIDAADNAEMAAIEFNQSCFAHELLREELPLGCKLVFLCRTERIVLLQPLSFVQQLELQAFSESETLENLKNYFPEASEQDGKEFHRLTNGNPRVQMNALGFESDSVSNMLEKLGPAGTTVENQIQMQLEYAVGNIKDLLPTEFHGQINSICIGLATLSPHIPILILAKAADVSIDLVKSFVGDIGRSLWITDDSVQFRDEPTETWFRNKFYAERIDLERYIKSLEPLSEKFTYAAEVLPQLYLQAEQYDKLINIALSDDYLPLENPIDARNVRVYRLQFAFKAALKTKQYKDAVKLAMRAGEEAAGDKRQLLLLQQNIDLLVQLQSKEKVQKIALKGLLEGKWSGSENIYSASLLSSIEEFKGEARGFLRASKNWLAIYFNESKKKKKDYNYEQRLEDQDILELSYAYLNIDGAEGCFEFLNGLKPQQAVFNIVKMLTVKLIDLGRFDTIDKLLSSCAGVPYFTIAISSELMKVGRMPKKDYLEVCLKLLSTAKTRIKLDNKVNNDDVVISSIVSFIEACIKRNLSEKMILKVLEFYVREKASRSVYNSHFSTDRNIFLRVFAIRLLLSGQTSFNMKDILPENLLEDDKSHENTENIRKFKHVINTLLPWYLVRLQTLKEGKKPLTDYLNKSDSKSEDTWYGPQSNYDLQYEISEIYISIIVFSEHAEPFEIVDFYNKYIKENSKLKISNWLFAVRAAFRLPHLDSIKNELEQSSYNLIKQDREGYTDKIADRYIKLARGVLPNSSEDASVYFDEAISIVSKFGDEIVQRWEAVAELAKKAADRGAVSDELAYRFIKVAELVGENAREKHWSRGEAIKICARMSSGVGIAALSRWRDRDIGRFQWVLNSLLKELTISKILPVSVTWSLTCFLSQEQLRNFVPECLNFNLSENDKIIILEDVVNRYGIEGVNCSTWKSLYQVACENELKNNRLESVISFYEENQIENLENKKEKILNQEAARIENSNLDQLFVGLDLSTPEGFSQCITRFDERQLTNENFIIKTKLWDRIVIKIGDKKIHDFVDSIFLSEQLEMYNAVKLFASLSKNWLKKVSFQKKWPEIVKKIGRKYASEIIAKVWFNFVVEELNLDNIQQNNLKSGLLEGLANGLEFEDAETFFGFARLASSLLNEKDAESLVDYSLSRFEMHMPDDYGDGLWSEWLEVSGNVNKNIAGFIWSALGSPSSEIRWQAIHSVRKLAELNCFDIIDALIEWLELDRVDAFGSNKFPFYKLHAKQYLLIALSRISFDKPEILKKHAQVFVSCAEFEHIIIHKFTYNIVSNIETAFPTTYDAEKLSSLEYMGKSRLPVIKVKYGDKNDSYWHRTGEIQTDKKQLFAFDFDRYWFDPLGNVFAISGKQVADLAASVLTKRWGVTTKGYNSDPRVDIWNNSSNRFDTEHSHSSYPRTDNLDFYHSYHALMVVASQLIKKMPVVLTDYDSESDDNWEEWIAEHLLTKSDGKWLADSRDQLPLKRPEWIGNNNDKNWDTQIVDDDFMNCLVAKNNLETWINVAGYWSETENDLKENYVISSALVSTETSQSLLNALSSCTDPYDAHLPNYSEDDAEIDCEPFLLKGWIKEINKEKGIDGFDPFSGNTGQFHYSIGDDIKKQLKMSVCEEGKNWYSSVSLTPSLLGEIWSSFEESKKEEPSQSGNRLKASIPFLKFLCKTLNCELIFNVRIQRNYKTRYNSTNHKYNSPILKIYIFSADGKLRNTKTSYELG